MRVSAGFAARRVVTRKSKFKAHASFGFVSCRGLRRFCVQLARLLVRGGGRQFGRTLLGRRTARSFAGRLEPVLPCVGAALLRLDAGPTLASPLACSRRVLSLHTSLRVVALRAFGSLAGSSHGVAFSDLHFSGGMQLSRRARPPQQTFRLLVSLRMFQHKPPQNIQRRQRRAFADALAVAVKLLFLHVHTMRMRQPDVNRADGIIGRRIRPGLARR